MSSASIHEVKCPICNTKQKIERYNSVNDYHSELFPKIVIDILPRLLAKGVGGGVCQNTNKIAFYKSIYRIAKNNL